MGQKTASSFRFSQRRVLSTTSFRDEFAKFVVTPSGVQIPSITSFKDEFVKFVVTPSGVHALKTKSFRDKSIQKQLIEFFDMIKSQMQLIVVEFFVFLVSLSCNA